MNKIEPGEFLIPKEYTFSVKNRVLTVKEKSDRWRKPGDFRCGECTHRVIGRCKKSSPVKTFVCEMKPKGDGLFYGAPEHGGKGCEMINIG